MMEFYKELEQYGKSDFYPFHMPGHKRNPECVDGVFPLDRDITEIDGFDNLHHAVGILKEAQEKAARLFGAEETYFSVNGSTAAILAAVSASVRRGGKILVARNCHKAVYHAMYLRNLHPVYVFPSEKTGLGINGAVKSEDIEQLLRENPDTEAVLITSPTYDGVVSDVEKIGNIAHKCGIPLIVDEAHGAHFHFSEYFPASAVELGADLVIQSVHKTLPSMTQTALLHRCSKRVDNGLLRRFMGIYQTSSPSYVLMASIDACVDKIGRDGQKMFITFVKELETARKRLEACKYIRLVTEQMIRKSGVFAYDPSKLIFSTVNSSLNGHDFAEILRKEFHIELEMEAEKYALALSAVGDTREGFERLCAAVEETDRRESLKIKEGTEGCSEIQSGNFPVQKMEIAEAMESEEEILPLKESMGRISAEFAYLYPPGIPLLVPGEQITGLFCENVRRYMEQGLSLQGIKDVSCEYIRVIKEERE